MHTRASLTVLGMLIMLASQYSVACTQLSATTAYVTRWRYTHSIKNDVNYCAPPGGQHIYGGKAYKWGIKPSVKITLTHPDTGQTSVHYQDVPESKWNDHAVWWYDNNPADNSRPHDTTMAFLLPSVATEPHNLFGRAKLGSTQYEVSVTLCAWFISITVPIVIGANTLFADGDAHDELIVNRFCRCDTCNGSPTPCVNTDCNGGCRAVYGYTCEHCYRAL